MSNIGTLSLIAVPGEIERKHFINNPDITFFKSVYRRHTNFSKFLSIEESEHNSEPKGCFGVTSQKYSLDGTIADLLSKVYLQHKITFTNFEKENPDDDAALAVSFFANLGTNIIAEEQDALKLTIGTNTIFQNSGLYLETKYELMNEMVSSVKKGSGDGDYFTVAPSLTTTFDGSASLVGCTNGSHFNHTTLAGGVGGLDINNGSLIDDTINFSTEYFYCIPDFSFNYDYGLAIPVGILRNTAVDFHVNYKTVDNVLNVVGSNTAKLESTCIKEYIHLDVEEKKRFITNSHTYITENYRQRDGSSDDTNIALSGLTGLVKYLLVVGSPDGDNTVSKSLSTPTLVTFEDMNLHIDSNPLNSDNLKRDIFSRLNLYNYFPGGGRDMKGIIDPTKNHGHLDSICVFPICLHPLNYTQPSGCISNINSGVKTLSLNFLDLTTDIKIFIVEYNLLRISDGQCQKMLGT